MERDEAFEYEDSVDMDDEDDGMDEEEDDDDDPSFGESTKKKKASKAKAVKEPRMSGPPKLKKRESFRASLESRIQQTRAEVDISFGRFPYAQRTVGIV